MSRTDPDHADGDSMDTVLGKMSQFSAAEEFLDYLGVDYDRAVVDVNRLHILKRFQQYIGALQLPAGLAEEALRAHYRALLARAYGDFVHSNATAEKVFKVFQDAAGVQRVSLDSLRDSLPR